MVVSSVEHGRANERLYARIDVENASPEPVYFNGAALDDKIHLQFGMEAEVEYLLPSGGSWQSTVGAGRDGSAPPNQLVVAPSQTGSAYVDWPLGLLTDFPAETTFRVTLVDSKQRRYSSAPFVFHDGRQRLQYVYPRR